MCFDKGFPKEMKVIRSVTIPLRSVLSEYQYSSLSYLMESLEEEQNKLMTEVDTEKLINDRRLFSKGKFRNFMLENYGKPYKNWDNIEGEKAKYYRIILGNVRHTTLSMRKQVIIAMICRKYNYDINNLQKIKQDLRNRRIKVSNKHIRKVCYTHEKPRILDTSNFVFDTTTEDKQVSYVNYEDGVVEYSIRVNAVWMHFKTIIPSHIGVRAVRFSRPIIQKNKKGELTLRASCEVEGYDQKPYNGLALGVDLSYPGPFVAAVTDIEGGYSTELEPSRELAHVYEKYVQLLHTYSVLSGKNRAHRSLLRKMTALSTGYDSLKRKHDNVVKEMSLIKEKITNIENHVSHLIARDIIDHALYHDVSMVKVQQLNWLEKYGIPVNYELIQRKIEQAAEYYGLSILSVHPNLFENINPFTMEKIVDDDETQGMNSHYLMALNVSNNAGRIYSSFMEHRDTGDSERGVKDKVRGTLHPGWLRDRHRDVMKRPNSLERRQRRNYENELYDAMLLRRNVSGDQDAVGQLDGDSDPIGGASQGSTNLSSP